jgi:hypothetical protein
VSDLGVALVAATTGAVSGGAVSYFAASAIARRAEGGRRAADARHALAKRLLAERTKVMAAYTEAAGHSGVLHGLGPERTEALAYDVVEALDPYPSAWADDVLRALEAVCGRVDVTMAAELPRLPPGERDPGWMRTGWVMTRMPELALDDAPQGSMDAAWQTGLADGGAAFNRLVADLDAVRAAVRRGTLGRSRLRLAQRLRTLRTRLPGHR